MPITITIIVLSLLYWLYYVITSKPNYATHFKGFTKEVVSAYDLTNGLFDKELLVMDEMAELCNIVYRDSANLTQDRFMDWKKLEIKNTGSEFIKGNDNKCLYFELWERNGPDTTFVAIVFRGTHGCCDIKSNLRWVLKPFTRNKKDHYDLVMDAIDTIVFAIKSNHTHSSKLKIISTGHSLGGGLAQLTAYAHNEIKHVYAFNPSPVTGYHSSRLKGKVKENQKDVVIYRIYESGEGLSFIRNFMSILYPVPWFKTKDPAIIRIRFSFSTGRNLIGQHAIYKLAENLRNYKKDKNYTPKKDSGN